MGRCKALEDKVQVHFLILKAVNGRLEHMSKEIGWSKTKIVEDAVSMWLFEREKEFATNKEKANGLAEIKQ
jgi:hypothetical protein